MIDEVILIDDQDRVAGSMEKLQAHRRGLLHRAFSIFVFNDGFELMLQQRSSHKYHSAGLWSNTCCSHPLTGESLLDAAHGRLQHEMGFDCPLREVFSFTYQAEVGAGLTEHEFDHVFIGAYNGQPRPNPAEARDWRWIELPRLMQLMKTDPDSYTAWLKLIITQRLDDLENGRHLFPRGPADGSDKARP